MQRPTPSSLDSLPPYTTRSTCRICGHDDLNTLFDLGDQYVSDFVEREKVYKGIRCPIVICQCVQCGLIQQLHTARQDFLYTRHYWYTSGTTQTMRESLKELAETITAKVAIEHGDVVLDIGANDGTLLRSYPLKNIVRVGVEPAKNLAPACREHCDIVVEDFWSERVYSDYMRSFNFLNTEESVVYKAKVVTAIGMFYDLEDPNQFIGDIAKVLAPDGVFVAQLMCLKQMLALHDVGNLAHEHLEFYSLMSLHYLFERHGLHIFDIEENKVNGGSYRLWVKHNGGPHYVTPRVADAYEWERDHHIDTPRSIGDWYSRIEENRRNVRAVVRNLVESKKKVWVLGASTKGNVLLQWYNLDYSYLEGASDKSPEKWGKYTIGTGIPIDSEENARLANPDYFLVLPYAFIDEFIRRERDFLERGGKFIVPLPELRIIGKEALQ